MERMVAVADIADDPVFAMRVRLRSAWYHALHNPGAYDLEACRQLAEEAIQTFEDHGAHHLKPMALGWLSSVEWDQGHMARAVELQYEALDIAIGIGDRAFIADCMINLLVTLDFGSAPLSEAFDRAGGFIEQFTDDRAVLSSALLERALMGAWLGRLDQARDDVAASRAIAEELGRRWDEQIYPVLEGYVAWLEHGPAAAEAPFTEGRRVLADAGDRGNAWFTAPPLARVLLELGRDADAEEILSDLRDNPSSTTSTIQALSLSGRIAARRGDLEAALRLSLEAEALAATTELLWDQAEVALDKAEVLLLAGRPAEARAAAVDALGLFERKEYAIGIRRARAFLAALTGDGAGSGAQ